MPGPLGRAGSERLTAVRLTVFSLPALQTLAPPDPVQPSIPTVDPLASDAASAPDARRPFIAPAVTDLGTLHTLTEGGGILPGDALGESLGGGGVS